MHLIAHSAGSNLIENFADHYKKNNALVVSAIHMTFLDAYCPWGSLNPKSCPYGKNATYAEQYVDARDLADLYPGWPNLTVETSTNQKLDNAINFDVTALDPEFIYYWNPLHNASAKHAFPHRQYLRSSGATVPDYSPDPGNPGVSTVPYNAHLELDAITLGATQLGAKQAAWMHWGGGGGNSAAWIQARKAEHAARKGTRCTLKMNSNVQGPCLGVGDIISDFVDTFFISVRTLLSAPPTLECGSTISQSGMSFSHALSTCPFFGRTERGATATAPGRVLATLSMDSHVDLLTLDYRFTLSAGKGQLHVYLDNALVFIASQMDSDTTWKRDIEIEIPRREMGSHEIRVVLHGLEGNAAGAWIENMVFRKVVATGIFSNGFEAPLPGTLPHNTTPVAHPQSVTTPEDTPRPITLSGSDPEADPLTFSVVTSPAHGVLSGTAPNLIYSPAPDYFGLDSFTFRVHDGTTYSAAATVSITVTPVNDAPIIEATFAPQAGQVGAPLLIPIAYLRAGFSDPDGDALTLGLELPPWLSFLPVGITGTPTTGAEGVYTITVRVTDPGGLWAEQTFVLTISPATPSVIHPLNDTGITWSGHATSANASFCDPAHPAGQDCHYGRDALAAAGQLTKIGAGNAGFDYSKISNSGTVLPASAALGAGPNDWACTRDNVTGLIWEVKVNDAAHLRHQEHRYTWYDPDSPDGNPGSTGNADSCNNTLTAESCNTRNYVQAVNVASLCGASNWRLPRIKELQSIVDYGHQNPAIDMGFFPNTPVGGFLSASPDVSFDGFYVLGVDFSVGSVGSGFPRNFSYRVRVVHSGQ